MRICLPPPFFYNCHCCAFANYSMYALSSLLYLPSTHPHRYICILYSHHGINNTIIFLSLTFNTNNNQSVSVSSKQILSTVYKHKHKWPQAYTMYTTQRSSIFLDFERILSPFNHVFILTLQYIIFLVNTE